MDIVFLCDASLSSSVSSAVMVVSCVACTVYAIIFAYSYFRGFGQVR